MKKKKRKSRENLVSETDSGQVKPGHIGGQTDNKYIFNMTQSGNWEEEEENQNNKLNKYSNSNKIWHGKINNSMNKQKSIIKNKQNVFFSFVV